MVAMKETTLNGSESARYLGVSREQIRQYLLKGALTPASTRPGNGRTMVEISLSELERFKRTPRSHGGRPPGKVNRQE